MTIPQFDSTSIKTSITSHPIIWISIGIVAVLAIIAIVLSAIKSSGGSGPGSGSGSGSGPGSGSGSGSGPNQCNCDTATIDYKINEWFSRTDKLEPLKGAMHFLYGLTGTGTSPEFDTSVSFHNGLDVNGRIDLKPLAVFLRCCKYKRKYCT